MSEHVRVDVNSGVLSIRLDRVDKKNALNRAMYDRLVLAFEQAANDDSVRAILIEGAPGAFCAGNDIGDFVRFAETGEGMDRTWDFLKALGRNTKPLVAAVDGLAIGIGATLMFHCDLAFATARSQFRTPFLDLGILPEAGSSLIAPRVMGPQRAFALLAMGDPLTGEEAREAGLVYRVVPEGELHGTAMEACIRLAGKPRQALAIARELMRGDAEEIRQRIALEVESFTERLKSQEARDAFARFMTRPSAG